MKSSSSNLVLCLLLATTLGAGAVHGWLTNRWGLPPDAALAAERLRPTMPTEVGAWRVTHEAQLTPDVVRMLQCPAHVSRVYEHTQTGDIVRLFVLVGPPGPIAVHTPEICGAGNGYAIAGMRQAMTVKDVTGQQHSMWEVPMKPGNNLDMPMRVLYGWSAGPQWIAAEGPRFTYGGLAHLYKLQMAVTVNPGSKATDFDPARDFLESFLPQLQPRLVEAKRGWTASL